MSKIIIDHDKCIHCEACVRDCITYSLEQNKKGYIQIAEGGYERCISCQHCFAICPVGAISFDNNSPENAHETYYGNPDDILNLIKSRRSIRQFNEEEVSKENLKKLKEMLPFIPTGCNYDSLHFSIVETRMAMNEIRKYVNEKILKLISNKFTARYAGKFAKYKTAFEKGEDIIFRNAPQMIVVSSDIKAPCKNVDPIIALSYIELYAQSLGLGTCWCGFAQACFKILPKLSNMVQIPNGYKPVYVMLLGNPIVKYKRVIMPKDFPISEIIETENRNLSFIDKIKRIVQNFI